MTILINLTILNLNLTVTYNVDLGISVAGVNQIFFDKSKKTENCKNRGLPLHAGKCIYFNDPSYVHSIFIYQMIKYHVGLEILGFQD